MFLPSLTTPLIAYNKCIEITKFSLIAEHFESLISECAGCHEELKEGQALVALDQQWHIWCFKCGTCGIVLHGEYMGRDGIPYCERDYQKQFGVKCAYCNRFISGKVLQVKQSYN